MIRSFTFVLRPLAAERAELQRWRTQCCDLYNAALEQRITSWRIQRQGVSYVDQCRDLTDLRKEPDYSSVPVKVQRSSLRRLEHAFKSFFRRCKQGATPGFPRFRSKHRYDSFGIGRTAIEPAEYEGGSGYVRVPKLGRVRFKQHRMLRGEVRDVELRYESCKDRWYVRIVCDVGEAPVKRVVRCVTGIDLGLKEFAVLSSGEAIHNPRHFRRGQVALRRAQRVLARKTRGSNSRHRARSAVARQYRNIRNQRTDFHRKLAASLCSRFDFIAHEDLNIKGLARSALAKSVSDVAWGLFLQRLACKAEEAGVHVVAVDPRNTTQACSACGQLVPKGLGDRIHACDCGCVLDRDHNAAINVLARGLRAVPEAIPAEVSDGGSVHF